MSHHNNGHTNNVDDEVPQVMTDANGVPILVPPSGEFFHDEGGPPQDQLEQDDNDDDDSDDEDSEDDESGSYESDEEESDEDSSEDATAAVEQFEDEEELPPTKPAGFFAPRAPKVIETADPHKPPNPVVDRFHDEGDAGVVHDEQNRNRPSWFGGNKKKKKDEEMGARRNRKKDKKKKKPKAAPFHYDDDDEEMHLERSFGTKMLPYFMCCICCLVIGVVAAVAIFIFLESQQDDEIAENRGNRTNNNTTTNETMTLAPVQTNVTPTLAPTLSPTQTLLPSLTPSITVQEWKSSSTIPDLESSTAVSLADGFEYTLQRNGNHMTVVSHTPDPDSSANGETTVQVYHQQQEEGAWQPRGNAVTVDESLTRRRFLQENNDSTNRMPIVVHVSNNGQQLLISNALGAAQLYQFNENDESWMTTGEVLESQFASDTTPAAMAEGSKVAIGRTVYQWDRRNTEWQQLVQQAYFVSYWKVEQLQWSTDGDVLAGLVQQDETSNRTLEVLQRNPVSGRWQIWGTVPLTTGWNEGVTQYALAGDGRSLALSDTNILRHFLFNEDPQGTLIIKEETVRASQDDEEDDTETFALDELAISNNGDLLVGISAEGYAYLYEYDRIGREWDSDSTDLMADDGYGFRGIAFAHDASSLSIGMVSKTEPRASFIRTYARTSDIMPTASPVVETNATAAPSATNETAPIVAPTGAPSASLPALPDGTWQAMGEPIQDGGYYFGSSLALSYNGRLLIGASTLSTSGKVYEYDGNGTWAEQGGASITTVIQDPDEPLNGFSYDLSLVTSQSSASFFVLSQDTVSEWTVLGALVNETDGSVTRWSKVGSTLNATVCCGALSKDGTVLVLGTSVYTFDTQQGDWVLQGDASRDPINEAAVTGVALMKEFGMMAYGASMSTVNETKVHLLETASFASADFAPVATLGPLQGVTLVSMAASNDGDVIVLASARKVWVYEDRQEIWTRTWSATEGNIRTIALDGTGQTLLVATYEMAYVFSYVPADNDWISVATVLSGAKLGFSDAALSSNGQVLALSFLSRETTDSSLNRVQVYTREAMENIFESSS